jgi:hypothetical protein
MPNAIPPPIPTPVYDDPKRIAIKMAEVPNKFDC